MVRKLDKLNKLEKTKLKKNLSITFHFEGVNAEQADDLMVAAFIAITFSFNIIFFILTTLRIRKVKSELHRLRSQEEGSVQQDQLNAERGK